MGHFGAEYDLSFEDYLSPFAPPTSRDAGPIPALFWEDGPFVPAEVTGQPPATEASEVAQEESLGGKTETEDPEAEELEEEASRGEAEDEAGGMPLEFASSASTVESIAGEVLEAALGQVSEMGRLSEEMERVGQQFEGAPATEADIADVFKLGKGIGRLGQGIGAALSVGPPSSAADVSVAVPEFNFLTRLSMPVPVLNAAANAKAVQWNGRHHPATSGVDPANIRTDVARYVNLTAIATAIQNFNAANPARAIQLGTPPMDAVLVEGIHQFQAKCFFETSQIDGMAGESTLDSLGLVKRSGMNSVDQRNTGAHARLGKVDVARLTSNEFTADTWFDHMVNPSFLGWRFLTGGTPRGVHLSFMRKLRTAERALLAQSKFSGKTPVELGKALGFNATSEEHKGARPTATSASMHTYGLAVDIKYTGNPWVQGADFLAALQRSTLLMSGFRITQTTSQQFLHDLGADATRTTAAIFDILAQQNRDFRDYLALSANAAGLTAVLQRRRAEGTAGVFAAATESIADAAQRWRTHIQNDLSNMRAQASPFRIDSRTLRDPLLGFLNLDRDLVIALRDTACLAWGAVDIGSGADGSGDMMHFDDRVCGIGHELAAVGGNFQPQSGHRCIACGAPVTSHEEPEALNGGDFEAERLEEVYDPPVPYPDVSSYEDPIPYAEPTISTESAPQLMAHELTHVAQERGQRISNPKAISSPESPAEREASIAAEITEPVVWQLVSASDIKRIASLLTTPVLFGPGTGGTTPRFVIHDTGKTVSEAWLKRQVAEAHAQCGAGTAAYVPRSGPPRVARPSFFEARRPTATQFERVNDLMDQQTREATYRAIWRNSTVTVQDASLAAAVRDGLTPTEQAQETTRARSELNATTGEVYTTAAWAVTEICDIVRVQGASAVANSPLAAVPLQAACIRLAPVIEARRERLGSTVNIETAQDTGSTTPGRGPALPNPAYNESQYDGLALLYLRAALQAHRWPQITTHFFLDRGIGDHVDPRCFDLRKLYRKIAKLMGHPQNTSYGITPVYGTSLPTSTVWWDDSVVPVVCGGPPP
jgi:hypothetical protein